MPRRAGGSRQKGHKRRSPGAQSLLVLHLDADKLRRDGLHLGEVAQFSGAVSAVALTSRVEIAEATTQASLLRLLGDLVASKSRFDVVVVVAHSNTTCIKIASDAPPVTWETFAKYLKPLRPRRLLLVACRAGRWDAGEALFKANRDLRRIYACPVNASKDFGAMMLFAIPYVVARRRPRNDHVLWSQVAAIALTGRQLREWRRVEDKGNPDSAVFDAIADLVDPAAQQVPKLLSSAVASLLGRGG